MANTFAYSNSEVRGQIEKGDVVLKEPWVDGTLMEDELLDLSEDIGVRSRLLEARL